MDARILLAIGCAAVALSGLDAHAQQRRVTPSTFGLPNPAGLNSRFPAGLPQPGPANLTSGSNPTTAAIYGSGTEGAPPTTEMGAVGAGGVANAGPQPSQGPNHPGPYTALEIARSFLAADVNYRGELTRAQASRLSIMPMSFDEMDTNHDNILTRSEYEDAFR